MKVGHDEVGVVVLKICRRNRHHETRQPAHRKQRDSGDRIQHRRFKGHTATPHRGHPVEYLHTGGDCDQHRGIHEEEFTG